MKRCPQCDFLYEDDQSFCDMDGEELAFDAESFPQPQRTAIASTALPAKSHSSRFAVAMMAAIVVAAISFVAYFTSSRLLNSRVEEVPPAASENQKIESSTPQSTPDSTPTTPIETPAPAKLSTSQSAANSKVIASSSTNAKSATPSSPRWAPARDERKPAAERSSQRPAVVDEKKDSRIGSILKKTGRMLKKPFKL